MPDEIATGFAAYCVAMASAFADIIESEKSDEIDGVVESVDDVIDQLIAEERGVEVSSSSKRRSFKDMTPEIRCGTEVYKRDRFFADSTTRLRTWNLKRGSKGASNRVIIFQDIWLDEDNLIMVHSVRDAIRDIDAQVKTINLLKRLRKQQSNDIIGFLYNEHVTEDKCKAFLSDLIDGMTRTLQQLGEMRDEKGSKFTAYHLNKMGEYEELLNKMIRAYVILSDEIGDPREIREGLRIIDGRYLDDFEHELGAWRSLLSKARSPLEKWRNDETNRAAWCEESVGNCVEQMVSGDRSIAWKTLQKYGPREFSQKFCKDVVPAIEEGFYSEACDEESVHAFRTSIFQAANALSTGSTPEAKDHYRAFLKLLVKSLIYGPESDWQSIGTSWDEGYEPLSDDELGEYIGQRIVVSQLLTKDGNLVVDARAFGPNDVVFFGRCYAIDAFIDKCRQSFSKGFVAKLSNGSKSLKVFPIKEEHGQVSNLHGMMMCSDGVWRYWDFSKFGTRIVGKGRDSTEQSVSLNGKVREIRLGDTLYLGAKDADKGERLFFKAAAMKVSFCLDADAIANGRS